MALYQPSNILPSTFAGIGGGVIDAANDLSVTWQVNGTTPMTAFRIDFYQNDAASTSVYSTGILTDNCPFVGTDANGDPVPFVYAPGNAWSSFGFANGKDYKLKITQYFGGQTDAAHAVVQYAESAFSAKETPVVDITAPLGDVTTVKYTFTGAFSQAQGDGINFVRWVLSDNTVSRVLKDTGNVSTGLIALDFDGLFDGHDYTISLTIQSSSGVEVTATHDFSVSYTQTASTGTLTARGADDGSVLLEWGQALNIPATTEGGTISDETLALTNGESVLWDTVNGENMSLDAQFAAWKGSSFANTGVYGALGYANLNPSGLAIHPSGAFGVMNGGSDAPGIVFKVEGNGFTQLSTLSGTGLIYGATFSPDGSLLVTAGQNDGTYGAVRLYTVTVNDGVPTITFAQKIPAYGGGITFGTGARCAAFSPDGGLLVVGAGDTFGLIYYTVSGQTVTLGNRLRNGIVNGVAFNGSGNCMAAACADGNIILYRVSGQTFTTFFNDRSRVQAMYGVCFVPNTNFVVCAGATGKVIARGSRALLYTYSASSASFVGQVAAENIQLVYTNCSASADGKVVSIGNALFSVDGTGLTLARLYPETVHNSAFDANGNLYMNGVFSGGNTMYYDALGSTQVIVDLGVVSLRRTGIYYTLTDGKNTLAEVPLIANATEIIVAWTASTLWLYAYAGSAPSGVISATVTGYPAGAVPSVTLNGYQLCDYLYLSANADYDLQSVNFEPLFDNDTQFYATFKDGYQAGTVSASGFVNNALYRENNGVLIPIAVTPTAYTAVKDYGIKAGQKYTYYLYYNNGGVYSAARISNTVCFNPRFYLLAEAERDENDPNVYHVIRSWKFGNNVAGGEISNGNEPNMMNNFTPYPFRQPSSYAARSGTLTALLSNFQNGVYNDTAAEMDELFAISQSPNVFFLRDMKGNFRMVHTNGAVTQTITETSQKQQVVISVPWVEVGDASAVSVIKTPQDASWLQNDVLDARLDVEAENGVLSVSYPQNYNGSLFSISRQSLISTVPDGMRDGRFTIDGSELNVTVDE